MRERNNIFGGQSSVEVEAKFHKPDLITGDASSHLAVDPDTLNLAPTSPKLGYWE